jgi:hypothetical protein
MKIPRFVILAIVSTIGLGRPALADPISITTGFLEMNPPAGLLVLGGDRGFAFSSHVDAVGGIFQPVDQCNLDPLRCRPGSALGLHAAFSDNDATGTAMLDGVTYTHVGDLNSAASVSVDFQGTAVLPPLSGSAIVTAPFLFSGTFIHPEASHAVSEALAGIGTVTLAFTPNRGFPGSWHLDSARYDFIDPMATPEPAPLLLMGAGLLSAAAIVRRGGRRPRAS